MLYHLAVLLVLHLTQHKEQNCCSQTVKKTINAILIQHLHSIALVKGQKSEYLPSYHIYITGAAAEITCELCRLIKPGANS